MLIHELGEERAKAVVKGWVNNTVKIFSSDTKLLKAIEAGQCDVGIVNTYYLGRIQRDNPESKQEFYGQSKVLRSTRKCFWCWCTKTFKK